MSTKCHIHKYTARRKFIPAGLPSENPVGGNKSNTLYTLSYTEILSYTASLYNTVCGLWILIEIQKNKLCKFVDIVCVYIYMRVCVFARDLESMYATRMSITAFDELS